MLIFFPLNTFTCCPVWIQSDATITVREGAELGGDSGGDGDNGVLRAQSWLKKKGGETEDANGGWLWVYSTGVDGWVGRR